MKKSLQALQDLINASERIVLLSGAGVSRASGIPDFRSPDGLYQREAHLPVSPETVLSHDYFLSHPEVFYRYYRENLFYPEAKPNAIHRYFARLEQAGRLAAVLTQNVDGLHRMAGSETVLELHGSGTDFFCVDCGKAADATDALLSDGVPHCPFCGGLIRPDIVLYGEPLDTALLTCALQQIAACDLLLCAGTSLRVEPVASLVTYRAPHTPLVILNAQSTPYDLQADLVIHDDLLTVIDALSIAN